MGLRTRKTVSVELDVDVVRLGVFRYEADEEDSPPQHLHLVRNCRSIHHYLQLSLSRLRHVD